MWPYHPELIASAVPRYTSYPTALMFDDALGPAELGGAIDGLPLGASLSLYLHIPYCEAICWYCGCNTGAANRMQRLERYLDALHAEIAAMGASIGNRALVGRLAFGGGSPNAIPPAAFRQLVEAIARHFNLSAEVEISVELDPRALTREWVEALALAGVDRVSMGVQSFSPEIQSRIGRIQPAELVEQSLASLRVAGIGAVNFDLMYGLPGQALDDLEQTLDVAVRMEPSRIALFGYAHNPDLFPRQRRIDAQSLPDAAARFHQSALGFKKLTSHGYKPVGFDHFALPGDSLERAAALGRVRRNFQGFTDDQSDAVLGIGASAISVFPGLIVQNEKNPGKYRDRIASGGSAAAKGVVLTAEDRKRGAIIEALLCQGRAKLVDPVLKRSGRHVLSPYERLGLLDWNKHELAITEAGRPYGRWIASAFDAYSGSGAHTEAGFRTRDPSLKLQAA